MHVDPLRFQTCLIRFMEVFKDSFPNNLQLRQWRFKQRLCVSLRSLTLKVGHPEPDLTSSQLILLPLTTSLIKVKIYSRRRYSPFSLYILASRTPKGVQGEGELAGTQEEKEVGSL